MGFINDNGIIAAQKLVMRHFGKQNTVGHQFDNRIG